MSLWESFQRTRAVTEFFVEAERKHLLNNDTQGTH